MNTDGPLISVIIVNFNGREYIGGCLESLREQAFKDFEIVVVDNGSHDGSAELVENLFPQARLIRLEDNAGFARASNIGIKNSRSGLIALLNNDAEADPAWLGQLYSAAGCRKEMDFFASVILNYENKELIESAGHEFRLKAGRSAIRCNEGLLVHESVFSDKEVFGACAAGSLYRRQALEDVGLFDEDFFCSLEDIDLDFRLQLRGHRCLLVRKALVYHRGSATRSRDLSRSLYFSKRNMAYVFIKNIPAGILFKYAPLLLAKFFTSFFMREDKSSKENSVSFIRALRIGLFARITALWEIPRFINKRKKVQGRRSVSVRYIESLLCK